MIGGTVTNLSIIQKTLEITVIGDVYKDTHILKTPLTSAAKCIEEDDAVFSDEISLFWTPKLRCWHDLKLELIGKPVLKEKKEEAQKAYSEKE